MKDLRVGKKDLKLLKWVMILPVWLSIPMEELSTWQTTTCIFSHMLVLSGCHITKPLVQPGIGLQPFLYLMTSPHALKETPKREAVQCADWDDAFRWSTCVATPYFKIYSQLLYTYKCIHHCLKLSHLVFIFSTLFKPLRNYNDIAHKTTNVINMQNEIYQFCTTFDCDDLFQLLSLIIYE